MGLTYWDQRSGRVVELVPVCPRCKANIYWSLHSVAAGAIGPAHCANNMSATRIITNPEHMITCDWEGTVMRDADGGVTIYDQNMRRLPHKVKQKPSSVS